MTESTRYNIVLPTSALARLRKQHGRALSVKIRDWITAGSGVDVTGVNKVGWQKDRKRKPDKKREKRP